MPSANSTTSQAYSIVVPVIARSISRLVAPVRRARTRFGPEPSPLVRQVTCTRLRAGSTAAMLTGPLVVAPAASVPVPRWTLAPGYSTTCQSQVLTAVVLCTISRLVEPSRRTRKKSSEP